MTEHLHDARGPRPRTIFATHYHELTQLAEKLPRLANAHVAVKEWGDGVVFLHRIEDGPADRSYGIHVAQLAGLPPGVIERAKVVLAELESERTVEELERSPRKRPERKTPHRDAPERAANARGMRQRVRHASIRHGPSLRRAAPRTAGSR